MTKLNLLILTAFLFCSCSKDSDDQSINASARIVDMGDPAVDGCGWHIVTDEGADYMPKNLEDDFKTDGIPVSICFVIDGKDACGLMPVEYPAIRLFSIRKK